MRARGQAYPMAQRLSTAAREQLLNAGVGDVIARLREARRFGEQALTL
ncbi:hypothetical protein [Nocardia vaccinii]|nr:hypothetical protein [Nocardia vaccinii]